MFLELPGESRFWYALQNAGHGLAFALLTATVLIAVGAEASRLRLAALLMAIFGLGVLIEIAQHATGRGASLGDLGMNLAGMVAGIGLATARHRAAAPAADRHRRLRTVAAASAGIAALLWCLRLPISIGVVDALSPSLPVLAAFERPFALARLGGGETPAALALSEADPRWTENATTVLEARFPSGPWPSFRLIEPPADWRAFEALSMRIFNPAEQGLRMHVRVDQRALVEDIFWYSDVELAPGTNEVLIDLGSMRPDVELGDSPDHEPFVEVSQILFFLSGDPGEVTLLFDDIVLQPRSERSASARSSTAFSRSP